MFLTTPEQRATKPWRTKYIREVKACGTRVVKEHFHRKLIKKKICERCKREIDWYKDERCQHPGCSARICYGCYEAMPYCSEHKRENVE